MVAEATEEVVAVAIREAAATTEAVVVTPEADTPAEPRPLRWVVGIREVVEEEALIRLPTARAGSNGN